MQLVPNLPKTGFIKQPHMKIYTGGLQKSLLDILDQEKLEQLPITMIHEKISKPRRITFVRHLESKYNEYKLLIDHDPRKQEFITTKNIQRKNELVPILLKEFFAEVGIDYETGVSETGHKEGEKLGKLYAELIQDQPRLFPDLICISPYLRTRTTAHYMLKHIAGLDVDFDKLMDENKLEDLIIGSFKGKDIALKIDERIRERDHGSNVAPTFIRNFLGSEKGFHDMLSHIQREKIYYYTSPAGGESQVQTNARAKEFLLRMYEKHQFKNIHVYSHHLVILGALLSVFGGSFDTFYKLNELWRPVNGSWTILSQIPRTQVGEENKFRVAGYNLSLKE